MRKKTPPELAEVGVKELTDHSEGIVKEQAEPPILIGHSFGGLIVQQLLDRGLAAPVSRWTPSRRKACWRWTGRS